MTYNDKMVGLYREFVKNRHLIWKYRREGLSAPWTDDPILNSYKFTNCFRVLDYGSQFVTRNLLTEDPVDSLARCVFYRITNLPATWDMLWDELGGEYPRSEDFLYRSELLYNIIHDYRQAGNTVFSGAYIIIPAPGTQGDKVWDALALTRHFLENHADDFLKADTQKDRYEILRRTPGLGKFLSMQILTDWGYGQAENRENQFVIAGPGAVRGAANVNAEISAERVIWDMAVDWAVDPVVNVDGYHLSLMDVQNTFCEFGKYVRYLGITRPRGLPYRPQHSGQEPLVLPTWMEKKR